MLSSPRRAIPYPNPDRSDRPDIPAHIKSLVDALELDMIYVQGNNAARLARTHLSGVYFHETDTGNDYLDDGTNWHQVSSRELAYVERAADITITGTNAAGATTIATAAAVVLDGTTKIETELYAPSPFDGTNTNNFTLVLVDNIDAGGDNVVCVFGTHRIENSQAHGEAIGRRCFTPAAGSHVFSMRAFVSVTGLVCQAGNGLAGNLAPAYLMIARR